MSPRACARCGSPLPEGARFCPACGAPAGPPPEEERRVVTVLFADLAGSTELAARLDPERFREVVGSFYRAVADQIVALRGQLESMGGDAVVGVFGLPHAHDDDALRAVRAGLALMERSTRLGTELGLGSPLRVRVGINTGQVAVVSDPGVRSLVLGAEVHRAARLQEAAAPDEVLVGETTWRLTRDAVEYGPRRDVVAKGFGGAIASWPALSLGPRSSRRTIPLVDRRQELQLLADTFDRALRRSRAHLVTLLGEPGIGKTRLAEEFLAQLPEGAKVLAGRADPFEEGVPFGSIAEMLRRELGEEREFPPERVLGRLRDVVGERVAAEEVEATVSRLALALGLGEEARDEGRYRSAEIRAGLLALLTGFASAGAVVLVLEDLHLAQPALHELVERLVRDARHLPLLVLCAARGELLEVRPGWAGGLADAVTLWVEPLALEDGTELAIQAGEGLDRWEAERVARHAGCNPLFIVEITGMLLHEGVALPSAPPLARLLPPTVQAVVAARLDHLSPEARELLRRASVFPRGTFDLPEIAIIARPRRELLGELEEEEFLVPDPDRPSVWWFRADLLRDVTYETLAKRERRRLHLQVAEALAAPETIDRYPRAIAYHLERAALASLDLDPNDRALADRAVEALVRAGDMARWGIESRAAIDLYERALTLSGPEASWGPREAWILSAIGEARYWLGEFEAAAGFLERALALGGDDVRVRTHACRFLADIWLTIRGNGDRAAELFDEALAAARELGDPFALARTLLMAGWVPYWRNDLKRSRAVFEEALEVARGNSQGDAWGEARALVGLASVVSPVGDEEEALVLARQALAIGEATNDPFTTAVGREKVASSLRRMLRLEEALESADMAVRTFRELGARWELASVLGDRGALHRLAGRLDRAEADLREAHRLCRDLGEQALVAWTSAELARILVARGEWREARLLLEEPVTRLATEEPGSLTSLLQAEAALALAAGNRNEAQARAMEGLAGEREQGVRNPLAAQVWWAGRLFGAEHVGGPEALEEARATLEAAHWRQALREPDLLREELAGAQGPASDGRGDG